MRCLGKTSTSKKLSTTTTRKTSTWGATYVFRHCFPKSCWNVSKETLQNGPHEGSRKYNIVEIQWWAPGPRRGLNIGPPNGPVEGQLDLWVHGFPLGKHGEVPRNLGVRGPIKLPGVSGAAAAGQECTHRQEPPQGPMGYFRI